MGYTAACGRHFEEYALGVKHERKCHACSNAIKAEDEGWADDNNDYPEDGLDEEDEP